MKKKITAIFLCVALVAIAIAGASLAYFTDTKTATNTFTMGNVKITLDETDITNPEGDRVTSNEYDVYPGAVVTKDPVVHNVGKNGAYIRATVNVSNWMNLVAAYYPDFKETFPNDGYKAALNLLVGELGEGWSVVGVEAGDVFTIGQFDAKFVLKYDGVLAAGADEDAGQIHAADRHAGLPVFAGAADQPADGRGRHERDPDDHHLRADAEAAGQGHHAGRRQGLKRDAFRKRGNAPPLFLCRFSGENGLRIWSMYGVLLRNQVWG